MARSFKPKSAQRSLTPDEALAKMEHFCAYQERCPQEVQRKLAELHVDGETADQILQVLEGEGYVNEERFALAYAGGKFRVNHWGRVRIRIELQRRRIAPRYIQQALEAIDEEEYRRVLQQLLEKKMQQHAANPQGRNKSAASLIRAGFEPELVFQLLEQE